MTKERQQVLLALMCDRAASRGDWDAFEILAEAHCDVTLSMSYSVYV